ncbi:MAG: hypothetical protein JWM27_2471 [Gemmatimonadetes bacterium]|nr:hypothetical protein [Gemmatimonadota bacterium]
MIDKTVGDSDRPRVERTKGRDMRVGDEGGYNEKRPLPLQRCGRLARRAGQGQPALRIFPAEMQLVQTRTRWRVPFSVTIRAG